MKGEEIRKGMEGFWGRVGNRKVGGSPSFFQILFRTATSCGQRTTDSESGFGIESARNDADPDPDAGLRRGGAEGIAFGRGGLL